MRTNILLLCVFLSMLSACIEEVDPKKLVDDEERIVVNGLISPSDSVLRIQVSKSESVVGDYIGEDYKNRIIIKDAAVKLRNDVGEKVDLTYNSDSYFYEVPADSFNIVAGQNYYVEVNSNGKLLNSSCNIPSQNVSNISYKLTERENSGSELTISFNDVKGQKNFYRVGGQYIRPEYYNDLYFGLQSFQTDAAGDGVKISATTEFYNANDTDSLLIKVANVDEIFYRYQYSSYNYSEDDPFIEPVVFPSNINGGLGIFAGYTLYEQLIIVK